MQKDYLLFSPALFGLNRKEMWPNNKPQWSVHKTVTSKYNAASEHPMVWGKVET